MVVVVGNVDVAVFVIIVVIASVLVVALIVI